MTMIPIFGITGSLQVNDWFLSVMIVSLLLMLIIMGPYRESYIESFSSMFRFKNPDGDVEYPLLSTLGFITIFFLSCLSIGISVTVYSQDLSADDGSALLFLVWFSALVLLCFLFKLLLYSTVNRILYNSQAITLKPARWNCFFVMSFSVAGFIILILSILVLFLGIPPVLLLVFMFLVRIMVIIGRIFKIKTSLFKNIRSYSGFILYLCAFEIAPVLIELVVLNRVLGLI